MNKALLTLAFCLVSIISLSVHSFAQTKINIVATSFHEFDWVNNIIKGKEDRFSVTLLLDSGVDLHSYQPTVQDVARISSADLFIHNGGVSDAWAKDILAHPQNHKLVVFTVMHSLGDKVKAEVLVEGMQNDEHAGHSHDNHAHHDNHKGHATHKQSVTTEHEDEHVWLSLKNAAYICQQLEKVIAKLDPENAAIYASNTAQYIQKIQNLDADFHAVVTALPRKTLIFADRFPFLYMMHDYDINYFAAFQGCSAETEASFKTVTFLAKKADELKANSILIIDSGMKKLAATIINASKNPKAQILTLNSLQSVTAKDIESAKSYLSLMQENLEVLKKALQ